MFQGGPVSNTHNAAAAARERLVICGVELVCCVMYAILGAVERGYHYLVPEHLVSGQDFGDDTDNRAIRDWLRYNQSEHLVEDETDILERWTTRR